MSPMQSSQVDRADFVVELARRLHAYGTTSQRLEAAIIGVAGRIGVPCEIWSNPTGVILSFGTTNATGPADCTRVLRMEPGDIDLNKLCAADAIAERVIAGEIDVRAGKQALLALERPTSRRRHAMTVFSFGLTSAAVAALLRTGWADIAAAAVIGWLIGLLSLAAIGRPRVAESLEALAALLATFMAALIATFIEPLALKSVVIAALIVLLPGMMLTNAVSELSSNHLVSGTARFAGALAVLLKLAFGTVAATQITRLLGWEPMEAVAAVPPVWLEWTALLAASWAFAVLFRADKRDYPLVMASAILAYLATRYTGQAFGSEAGVFFAGLVVSAASNLYARLANRPGALVRVPGIILLVPGSVGFRSLSFVFERDVSMGLDSGVLLLTLLISLVAGLLFGNLLVPPRRSL